MLSITEIKLCKNKTGFNIIFAIYVVINYNYRGNLPLVT